MSEMMLARPYTNMPLAPIRRQGLGDPISDAVTALTSGTNAKIDRAKVEIMEQVAKEGREAKIYAVAGGLAAGFIGAFLYNRFLR